MKFLPLRAAAAATAEQRKLRRDVGSKEPGS